MKREYALRGVGCAHCAKEIEKAVSEIKRVERVNLNFAAGTLTIYSDYDVSEEAETRAREFEPAAKLESSSAPAGQEKGDLTRVAVGAALFVAALAARYFNFNGYIVTCLFAAAYLTVGGDVLINALRNIARGRVFDENFLMAAASIGAMALGEYPEAVAVMLFYQIGEYFQEKAVSRSRKSIAGLMEIRPDYANVKRNGGIVTVAPEDVETGEIIIIKPGEKIPLDGIITDGVSTLDARSLTGESMPRAVREGDTALSGCVNQSGLLTMRVSKPFSESTVSKILDLIENAAAKKAPTENFITVFAKYYTPAVVALAFLIAVVPSLMLGGDLGVWVRRGLLFLVVSCPCALVISVPLGFFGGIGAASKRGVLIKGSNFLEALNTIDVVVFDKTGTLTKGVLKVSGILAANGFTKEETLKAAAFAEAFSSHPIAASIRAAYGGHIDESKIGGYKEEAGQGVFAVVDGVDMLAGSAAFLRENGVYAEESEGVCVAVGGKYAGRVLIADETRSDSREAVARLKKLGVKKTVMLTGDSENVARKLADELGIDEVHARLLPHEKVKRLEAITGKAMFVGDGINDAPALARADVGVAMGGLGSDAAIEAADVVIMTDEPSKLADALKIARATKRVVWQNIIFALSIKGVVLLLGALGFASMWAAVFADVGVAILAVLNATRVMYFNPMSST
jgi:Cd2+/Zn2+-exporting ATPase